MNREILKLGIKRIVALIRSKAHTATFMIKVKKGLNGSKDKLNSPTN